MYERAKYYENKFIRSGIAGFAMSLFFIYRTFSKDITLFPITILFLLVACAWLYFGLRIKNSLKRKIEADGIPDERTSFRQFEYILRILIFASFILSFRHWQYATYFTAVVLIIYVCWFTIQMKLLNDYFKGRQTIESK